VGVGTTNPTYKLDVSGSLRVTGQTVFNGVAYTWPTSAGSAGQVLTTNGSGGLSWTSAAGGISGTGTQNYLAKWTGSTTLGDSNIYIDTYGKIGIGTTTPQAELHVEGSIYSSVDASIGGIVYVAQGVGIGAISSPSAVLHVYGTGGNIALFGNSDSFLSSNHQVEIVGTGTLTPLVIEGGSGAIEFWKDLSPSKAIAFGMATPGSSITDDFVISTWTGSYWYERFRIQTSSGNVGIGTTSPTAKLHIQGSTGYNQLRLGTSYTPTGTSDSNGNTGDIAWDNNYLYVKTSVGWKRVALSSF